MKFLPMAPGAAFAALFLVGGCGGAPRDSTAAAPAQKGTALARADLPRPPAIPDEATDAQAAPLNEAGEIASEISSNTMIERVPVNGGLAWREDGEVVRTASSDGSRIAYFRPGEDEPFLVQRHGLAVALNNGRPQIAYDSDGRPLPVSDAARAEAARLAELSRREQVAAEQAQPRGGDSHRH
jgi:hypothetical protein